MSAFYRDHDADARGQMRRARVTDLTPALSNFTGGLGEPTIAVDAGAASAQTRPQSAQPVHVSIYNVHAVQPAIGGGR
jgi:hypothetical protein